MMNEDVWAIAQKLMLPKAEGGYSSIELQEIFGNTNLSEIFKLPAHNVIELIDNWEKNKIKVGDIVLCYNDIKALVLDEYEDKCHLLTENGCVKVLFKRNCEKVLSTKWVKNLLKLIESGEKLGL